MPTASEAAIGVVFVKEVTVFCDSLGTPGEEACGEFVVACKVERICDKGTISVPAVGVGVSRKLGDIAIICGDDGSIGINLCAQNEEAAFVESDELL